MRSVLSSVAVLLALCGCAQAASKAPAPVAARPAEAAVAKESVEIAYAGQLPGKPPVLTLQLDVTLRNPAGEPRWFILPSRIPAMPAASGAGVTGVEVYEGSGSGRAVLGKFLGTAGFQAVLVPAGGEVTLQKLGVTSRGKPAESLALDVVIAKELTVGTEPAAAWFGADPKSDASATVDASKLTRAGAKMTEDRSEVPVKITEDRRVRIDVTVR